MEFRFAIIEDCPALSEFATRTFYQTYAWYNTAENMKDYVESYFSVSQLEKEISERKSDYLLAEVNGKIHGYAKITNGNNKSELGKVSQLEIERIYVDESEYGKGTGKKLLGKIIDFSNENKVKTIWLGVWKKNERALAFYKRNHFEVFGEQHFILGEDVQDDFLMKLEL